MVYKQTHVSRHLGCLFQICMTNILIWFSSSATHATFAVRTSLPGLPPATRTWVFCHSIRDCSLLVILLNAGRNQIEMDAHPGLSSSQVPDLRQATEFLSASVSSLRKSVKLSISQIHCHCCDYSCPHYHHVIIGH